MPRKIMKFLIILIATSLLSTACATGNNINKKTANLVNILNNYHYRKLPIDNKFVLEIKSEFINRLDPYKLYFTRDDVTRLLSIKLELTSPKNTDALTFIKRTALHYRQNLGKIKSIITRLMKTGFNYTARETIGTNGNTNYPANKHEFENNWKKLLKYKILKQFYYTRYKGKKLDNYKELFISDELKIRTLVENSEMKIINTILHNPDKFESYISSLFLDTITSKYDAHSMYFSAQDRKNFEASLSTKTFSFGIYFKKNLTGEVQIDRLVPGGPAWKSSRLNKNDLIIQIEFPSENKKIVSLQELSLYDLHSILNTPRIKKVLLTVKKYNSRIETVSLTKVKLINEENVINSFVLKGNYKIGYIYLPAFYTEWDIPGAPACANDVAKEILKLKREKVDGIIFDLRNNSGGSLSEAIQLAGIFIDEGPICIQSSRDSRSYIIKDPVRGTVYTGPLVIMVNQQSASASEFFAVAMKDYNRAVIVGSPTYGKATSQVILPLVADLKKVNPGMLKSDTLDYAKITTHLYYGLSRKTHQADGLKPDVILPALFTHDYTQKKNKLYGTTLVNTRRPVIYEKGGAIPRSLLSRKSSQRIAGNKNFHELKKINQEIKKHIFGKKEHSLNINTFIMAMNRKIGIVNSIEKKLYRSSSAFTVANNASDSVLIQMDSYTNSLHKQLIRQIREDVYINEAYSIMKDYIKFNNKRRNK